MNLEQEMKVVGSYADNRLLAGRIGNVGVMLINQPQKRNAISVDMWDGIRATLDLFAADPEVRVVVYAGAGGKAFTAGGDISEFAEHRKDAESDAAFQRRLAAGRERLRSFPKPSIACIQGFCLGGGMAVALTADLRVAAADAQLGIPAAKLSISYGAEPLERLVQLVGPSRARLIMYTARKFSAQEAFEMGLVDVVAKEDVVRECIELARTIAGNAPLSVLSARFTIEQVLKPAAERDVEELARHAKRCMDSADFREGRTAFMEKRKPVFTGT